MVVIALNRPGSNNIEQRRRNSWGSNRIDCNTEPRQRANTPEHVATVQTGPVAEALRSTLISHREALYCQKSDSGLTETFEPRYCVIKSLRTAYDSGWISKWRRTISRWWFSPGIQECWSTRGSAHTPLQATRVCARYRIAVTLLRRCTALLRWIVANFTPSRRV
jgi:hypothetical protein